MTSKCFRSSRPAACVVPRAYTDPSLRLKDYGPIQPMEQRQEPINWAVWIAIGLAFAVGVFATNVDVFL